jgi:hypothetical protein
MVHLLELISTQQTIHEHTTKVTAAKTKDNALRALIHTDRRFTLAHGMSEQIKAEQKGGGGKGGEILRALSRCCNVNPLDL